MPRPSVRRGWVGGRRAGSRSFLPRAEGLECREVLSRLVVTTLADSGPGSLRDAIAQAGQDADLDRIVFAPWVRGTIVLASALPDLSGSVYLAGPGASALTVARSADPATPQFRIFKVSAGSNVTIRGLTITGGRDADQGGIFNDQGTLNVVHTTITGNVAGVGAGISTFLATTTVTHSNIIGNGNDFVTSLGGGIFNVAGALTITHSRISANKAFGLGAGIFTGGGGSSLTLITSTVSDNTMPPSAVGSGGGIFSGQEAPLTIVASTISGNRANERGGGIDVFGPVTLTNSTVSGNRVTQNDTAAGFGGGIASEAGLTMVASTVAENQAALASGVFLRNGGSIRGSLFANGPGGNLVNQATDFVSQGNNLFSDQPNFPLDPTDLVNTDPRIGPLANNGGPTQTHALLPGSPAIRASVPIPGVVNDQRGVRRPAQRPDIGAFQTIHPKGHHGKKHGW